MGKNLRVFYTGSAAGRPRRGGSPGARSRCMRCSHWSSSAWSSRTRRGPPRVGQRLFLPPESGQPTTSGGHRQLPAPPHWQLPKEAFTGDTFGWTAPLTTSHWVICGESQRKPRLHRTPCQIQGWQLRSQKTPWQLPVDYFLGRGGGKARAPQPPGGGGGCPAQQVAGSQPAVFLHSLGSPFPPSIFMVFFDCMNPCQGRGFPLAALFPSHQPFWPAEATRGFLNNPPRGGWLDPREVVKKAPGRSTIKISHPLSEGQK